MPEHTVVKCDGCLELSNYDEVDIFEKRRNSIIFRCPFCGLIDESFAIFNVLVNDPEEEFLTKLHDHPEMIMEL